MIRRTLLAAAAAAALTVLPTAAMAYDAPGYDLTVSDSTPTVNQQFTATVTGNAAGAAVSLAVTCTPTANASGTGTMTVTASATGAAVFNLAIGAEGTCRLAATGADGALLGDAVVVVGNVTPVSRTLSSGVSAGGTTAAAGGVLSATGFDSAALAAGAGVLVLAGAGAVVLARRRQAAQV